MKALIPAGGLAKRLGALTLNRPNLALPVARHTWPRHIDLGGPFHDARVGINLVSERESAFSRSTTSSDWSACQADIAMYRHKSFSSLGRRSCRIWSLNPHRFTPPPSMTLSWGLAGLGKTVKRSGTASPAGYFVTFVPGSRVRATVNRLIEAREWEAGSDCDDKGGRHARVRRPALPAVPLPVEPIDGRSKLAI